ncbi:MAG: hypothetical protein DHS20C17_01090 [Cyclobacteriaceae bacterium]|nr:MAG: hypothetical protein DHS20C17_01090 [Cyclobacteriaceae bacterium]
MHRFILELCQINSALCGYVYGVEKAAKKKTADFGYRPVDHDLNLGLIKYYKLLSKK